MRLNLIEPHSLELDITRQLYPPNTCYGLVFHPLQKTAIAIRGVISLGDVGSVLRIISEFGCQILGLKLCNFSDSNKDTEAKNDYLSDSTYSDILEIVESSQSGVLFSSQMGNNISRILVFYIAREGLFNHLDVLANAFAKNLTNRANIYVPQSMHQFLEGQK